MLWDLGLHFLVMSQNDVANIPNSEMQALFDLYNATNGANWTCCSPAGTVAWNFSTINADPCKDDWQGIKCLTVASQYSISSLSLTNRYLNGNATDSLSSLINLTFLDLSENFLVGTIPSSLGNLSLLIYLYVYDNALTGAIPSSLGKLSQMNYLGLYENSLNGPIPTSLGDISQLLYFAVSSNYLSESIPSSLGGLSHLMELYLDINDFTGTIPSSLGGLSQLTLFYLYDNCLTGTIPTSLGGLTNLDNLYLENNCLVGSIPSAIGDLLKLSVLSLNANSLTGSIPSSLGQLLKVEYLFLYMNCLTGTIPNSFDKLSSIDFFELTFNFLTGTIPSFMGDLPISDCQLNVNSFSGTIPASLGNSDNKILNVLFLDNNCLTGQIPTSFGELSHVYYMDVSHNGLTGTIPALGTCLGLIEILLESNHLSGSLDGVFEPATQKALFSIQVSDNQLSGTFPGSLFELPSLNAMVAFSNCFQGTLPESVCNNSNLATLILDGLSSSAACRRLVFPGLSDAYVLYESVHGQIPMCLLQSSHISTLHLSGNSFTGSFLDNNIAISHSLIDLSISHNALTGIIGENFQTKIWTNLDVAFNNFDGTLLTDFAVQENYTSISFENNRLSGNIPGSLYGLWNISLLGTNLFWCNSDGSDLPKYDNGRSSYSCGSSDFNTYVYIWLSFGLLSALVLSVLFHRRHDVDKYIGVTYVFRRADELLSHTKSLSSTNSPLVGAGKVFDTLLRACFYCTVFIVIVCLPMYCILSYYYGEYTHQYAYTASAAFLSGVVPFALEFSCMIVILVMMLVLLHENRSKEGFATSEIGRGASVKEKFLIYPVFVGVNVLLVGAVNVGYVYVVLYENNSWLFMAQIFLSIFKTGWNTVLNLKFLEALQKLVHSSRSQSRSIVYGSLLRCVTVINNIVIPLLVVMVISPDCFYNIFVAAPVVSAYYVVPFCSSFVRTDCLNYTLKLATTSYSPPFVYDYLCSSSFITYYSPIYAFTCLSCTFLQPLGQMLVLQLHKRAVPGTTWYSLLNSLLPPLLRPLSANTTELECNNNRLFDADITLNTATIYLSLLLTYGVVFPPLGFLLALALLSFVLCTRLALGQCIDATAAFKGSVIRDLVDKGCIDVIDTNVSDIAWLLVTTSCFFYSLYLFDTLGSAVGFNKAYWVLIVVPLLPLLLYVAKRWVIPSNKSNNVSFRERIISMLRYDTESCAVDGMQEEVGPFSVSTDLKTGETDVSVDHVVMEGDETFNVLNK